MERLAFSIRLCLLRRKDAGKCFFPKMFSSCILVPLLLPLLLLLLQEPVFSQDFTGIGRRRPLVLSGSFGAQASTRLSPDAAFHDPFSYVLGLQLNPVVYGFSIPVSLSFADSRFSYSQPFSRFSIQPSYKWIKAYLGRTSLEMHPYGLRDHQFDGAGISLQPENFPLRFMAMYGRFSKARLPDSASWQEAGLGMPSYKRAGYAFKLDFVQGKQRVGLHFFHAMDKAGSLPEAYSRALAPQGNMVLALDFSFEIYRQVHLYGQAALSNYTENIGDEIIKPNSFGQRLRWAFLPRRLSSSLSGACKAGLSFKGLSLSYERVAPGYRSMGAYYFNQDFENLVLAFSRTFPVADFRAEIGWQHDGLQEKKAGRMDRIVGSAYVNWRIGERFSTTGSYSNFTSYTQVKPVDLLRPDEPFFQDFDTVPFRQVSQQAQWSLQFRTGRQARFSQEAGLDFSYQSSRLAVQETFSDYFYATLRHGIVLGEGFRLQSSLGMSACIDKAGGRKQPVRYGIGPSAGLSKAFFERALQCSFSSSYYADLLAKESFSGVWGMRAGFSYQLKKAHRFELNLSSRLATSARRAGAVGPHSGNFQFQAVAGYRYQFHTDPFSGKKKGKGKKERRGNRELGPEQEG